MAFNKSLQINDNTYAGERLEGFINAAVLAAESINRNIVTPLFDVRGGGLTMNIGRDLANPLATYTCDFSAAEATQIDERQLTLTKLKVDREYCKDDWFSHWLAYQTGARSRQELPAEFQDWLEAYMVSLIGQAVEQNIWQGNYTPGGATATQTSFTGILEILDDEDDNVVDLLSASGGNAAIASFATPADVTYNMQLALDELPVALRGRYQTVKFIVSAYTYELYFRDLADNGLANLYQSADRPVTFLGYEVVIAPGMAENAIVLGESTNLYVGTTANEDLTTFKVKDMSESDLSDNVRFRASLAIGCEVGIPGDVVLVRPSIT
jgi:hypothetical protein